MYSKIIYSYLFYSGEVFCTVFPLPLGIETIPDHRILAGL